MSSLKAIKVSKSNRNVHFNPKSFSNLAAFHTTYCALLACIYVTSSKFTYTYYELSDCWQSEIF